MYCYTTGNSLRSSGDGSQDIQPTILPIANSTINSNESTAENANMFQLDLADWRSVGEGVLIPFERVTITGKLGEGEFYLDKEEGVPAITYYLSNNKPILITTYQMLGSGNLKVYMYFVSLKGSVLCHYNITACMV